MQQKEQDAVGHHSLHVDVYEGIKNVLDNHLLLPRIWEKKWLKEQQKSREKYEKEFIQAKWSEFYGRLYKKGIVGALEFVFEIVVKLMLVSDKTR